MLGKNHLITNTASVLLIHEGLRYVREKCKITDAYVDETEKIVRNAVVNAVDSIYIKFTGGKYVPTAFSQINWTFMWHMILGLVLFYLGTLLPDIDNKESILGRYVHLNVSHRTWTHTIWALMICGIIALFVPIFWWLWLGYFLHVFWDGFSRGGICWFYPISKYRSYADGAMIKKGHRLKLYRVGQMSETVITILVCVLTVSLIVIRNVML